MFDEDNVPAGVNADAISHEDYLNGPGEKVTNKFDVAGTYGYYCEPHQGAGMQGTIVVSWNSSRTRSDATGAAGVNLVFDAFFFIRRAYVTTSPSRREGASDERPSRARGPRTRFRATRVVRAYTSLPLIVR